MRKKEILPSTEEMIDQYADMVYRIAMNEMRNREDAEDVFQEVFLRLVRYRSRIENEEHLKAWLIRVTINCAAKHHGNAWNRKVVLFDGEEENQSVDGQSDREYERVENAGSPVSAAVAGLPEKYRIAVHLFYYEEMSVEQIAGILGEMESTVKSRLHRARQMLKIELEGEELL